jgi:uncharacterized membrane protein (DUF485 family)
MTDPATPSGDIHSEAFLHRLMRRQLTLSILCASAFLLALVGLPLLNYLAPDLMARRVGGFTLSWLVLGRAMNRWHVVAAALCVAAAVLIWEVVARK